MNQKEERKEQLLRETLEALGLSEKNKELAERYLFSEALEKKSILNEVQRQDFHTLGEKAAEQSAAYEAFCREEQMQKEWESYVRFAAAAGGSTLCYVLGDSAYIGPGWLSAAQEAAFLAEQAAWEEERLNQKSLHRLFALGEKRPRTLREAIRLCCRKGYNVQLLLTGMYLYFVKPKYKAQGRAFGETEHASELSGRLVKVLISSLPLLVTGLPDDEQKKLKTYAEQSELSGEFPKQFHDLFCGRKISAYLLRLLAGSAFLAIEHSERFLVILRLLTAMDMETVLEACLDLSGDDWFLDHLELIENVLPVPAERYVRWCASRRIKSALLRVSFVYPQAVQKAAAALSTEDYQYLMRHIKTENAVLYQNLNPAFAGVSKLRLAEELTAHYTVGRSEAKRYLLGKAGPELIYPFVDTWREMDKWIRLDYEGTRSRQIHALAEDQEHIQMYRRAVVLEGLCHNVMYFTGSGKNGCEEMRKGIEEEVLLAFLEIFEKENIPVQYQTDLLERLCRDASFSPEGRQRTMEVCTRVLAAKGGQRTWHTKAVRDGPEKEE